MPVVINEFETVADAPPRQGSDEVATKESDNQGPPDPQDVKPVLRAIETRALRAWAH